MIALLIAPLLASAQDSAAKPSEGKPTYPLPPPTLANVRYGPHERQVLDFWQTTKTQDHAPLLFYIHGGAWNYGDKDTITRGINAPQILDAGAGAAAAGADAGGVDVPLSGLAADELEGASGVFEWPFDGGLDSGGVCLRNETVLDGHDSETGVEALFEADDAIFGAAIPTAAVDEEHEWGGCFGGGFVEVDDLAGIAAVGDVGERGLDGGRSGFGRGFRFCRRLGLGGGVGLGGGGLGLARAEDEGKGKGEQGAGQAFHGLAERTWVGGDFSPGREGKG
jgi:hypothetical protein